MRFLPWPLVSRILALLLLAAAFLKANGLGFETVASKGIFSGPEFQIALVELEIILGIWLMWGKNPVGSWITSLVVFTGLAGASCFMGWIGQASCSCFGRLTVNPWLTFVIDLAAIGALVVGRPELKPVGEKPGISQAIVPVTCAFGGVVAFLAVLVGFSCWQFGSTEAALAYFRGERLSIRPRLVDVGQGMPGEDRTETVDLVNWTDQPITNFSACTESSPVRVRNR